MAHSNWNGGDRKLEILNIKRTNIYPKVTKERTAAIRLVYSSFSSKHVAQHALTLKNICLPFTEQTKNVNMPKYKRNADMFITCKITELSTYFQRCKVYSRVLIIPLNKILIILSSKMFILENKNYDRKDNTRENVLVHFLRTTNTFWRKLIKVRDLT